MISETASGSSPSAARPLTKSGIPVVEPKCTLHTSYHCPVSYYPVEKIKEISGHPELIFPGDRDPDRPMSENTINRALRLMGYDTKTEVCGHGFRTMACSVLIESGMWSQDVVERQMSHQERNSVRAVYIHKAEHLDARKLMMQW